jgi:hypothetical protein
MAAPLRSLRSKREIDLILPEDIMFRHHNIGITRTAVACRTGAMLVVLLGAAAVLAHSVVTGGRQLTAATKAPQLEQRHTP